MQNTVSTPRKSDDINLLGFPSAFAAFKWLDRNAVGPCSWKLNGHPGTGVYDPTFDASEVN